MAHLSGSEGPVVATLQKQEEPARKIWSGCQAWRCHTYQKMAERFIIYILGAVLGRVGQDPQPGPKQLENTRTGGLVGLRVVDRARVSRQRQGREHPGFLVSSPRWAEKERKRWSLRAVNSWVSENEVWSLPSRALRNRGTDIQTEEGEKDLQRCLLPHPTLSRPPGAGRGLPSLFFSMDSL